ncbi:MAG: VPLPA-CTERM sorting domain-containing protein [Pseudomonadota bacterium]
MKNLFIAILACFVSAMPAHAAVFRLSYDTGVEDPDGILTEIEFVEFVVDAIETDTPGIFQVTDVELIPDFDIGDAVLVSDSFSAMNGAQVDSFTAGDATFASDGSFIDAAFCFALATNNSNNVCVGSLFYALSFDPDSPPFEPGVAGPNAVIETNSFFFSPSSVGQFQQNFADGTFTVTLIDDGGAMMPPDDMSMDGMMMDGMMMDDMGMDDIAPIPVPAGAWLMLTAIAGLFGARFRQQAA